MVDGGCRVSHFEREVRDKLAIVAVGHMCVGLANWRQSQGNIMSSVQGQPR